MPDKVRSHCTQVYNYHRLLTWDKEQGLHIDIFKVTIFKMQLVVLPRLLRTSAIGISILLECDCPQVPTCCSCQVLKSPFLTSSSPPRRPGGYVPQHLQQQQQQQQSIGDFSQLHETVVGSESGRPVPPQYTLKPFSQVRHHSHVVPSAEYHTVALPCWILFLSPS